MATVLVIDDEQAIVDLLVDLVTDCGDTALSVRNGSGTLALGHAVHSALIIRDVMIPEIGLHLSTPYVPIFTETIVVLMSAAIDVARLSPGVLRSSQNH